MPLGSGPAEIAMGPMLIGTVFNVLLYGIMITQVYLYFQSSSKDRVWMKYFVICLFIADTVNCVFDLVYVYTMLVKNFANVEALGKANWIFGTDPAMTGIIASAVQFFFAWRVKVVTGNWWLVTVILVCALSGMLSGIGTAVAVGVIPEFTEFIKFKVIVILWLVSAAVADVSITAALTFHLQKQKTGFAATDDIVNRIIILTVQTGAITAIVAIIDLTLFLVDTSGTHLIFNVPLSKLYTNSLMSSLNARGGWKLSSQSRDANSTAGVHTTKSMVKLSQSGGRNARPEVFVHVESHEMVDKENPNQMFPESESEADFNSRDQKIDSAVSPV